LAGEGWPQGQTSCTQGPDQTFHTPIRPENAGASRCPSFAFSSFLYRYRNLVERFFGKLKNARGSSTRYDKRSNNFLAAIKLFCTRLWIAAHESTA
jgi:transposase